MTVTQKKTCYRYHIFDDTWTWIDWLITIILGHLLLCLQATERWFHSVHLTYSMQLSYLGKLSKPENQELTVYRAMRYSAKRGIAIACRLSVRPSVCNVGGSGAHTCRLGWKPWKLIARTISPTPSLFAAQRPPT